MMTCEHVQEQLADLGLQALKEEPVIQKHLSGCVHCHTFFLALQEVDAQLAMFPPVEAPQSLVDSVLAMAQEQVAEGMVEPAVAPPAPAQPSLADTISDIQPPDTTSAVTDELKCVRPWREVLSAVLRGMTGTRVRLALSGALVIGVAAMIFLPHLLMTSDSSDMEYSAESLRAEEQVAQIGYGPPPSGAYGGGGGRQTSEGGPGWDGDEGERGGNFEIRPSGHSYQRDPFEPESPSVPAAETLGGYGISPTESDRYRYDDDDDSVDDLLDEEYERESVERNERDRRRAEEVTAEESFFGAVDSSRGSESEVFNPYDEPAPDMVFEPVDRIAVLGEEMWEDEEEDEWDPPEEIVNGRYLPDDGPTETSPNYLAEIEFSNLSYDGDGIGFVTPSSQPLSLDPGLVDPNHVDEDFLTELGNVQVYNLDVERARTFLAERENFSAVTYQEPRGYWLNTYVPGDPVLRELQRRLTASADNSQWQTGLTLASSAETYAQPFDSPTGSALAVYLHGDQTGVQQPTRMLVQVGIQATDRRTGRRPAMNIGVVLDLSGPVRSDDKDSIQALLETLSDLADVGDQFSLVVAGQPGGIVIEPGDFGYGQVTVATEQLFSDEGLVDLGEPHLNLSVVEAYRTATMMVGAIDDPTAPLGSSLVLLVTTRSLAGLERDLQVLAHDNAVAGIPTSVVGVGNAIDLGQLDAIALAGQGNRRLLGSANEAEGVVEAELTAASRVVARAVRLRIRLAPGVELIDVLGSYRLDEDAAERVREAEQSIDQRLSRNLGIQADRGEDEDGIQIVIPAFYAGVSHVVLLDVVVPGAGPVADVTIRYKDLVQLENGVARDHFSLDREENNPGPLERNVLKNLLAYELSETLRRAGLLVAEGHAGTAQSEIEDFLSVLRGLQEEVQDFHTDPELFADIEMLSRYLLAFDPYTEPPNDLADSLLYASYLKLLPPPDSDD